MAKKILCVIALMLALVCVLTSCGCDHAWTTQTCEEGVYCTKCGEIQLMYGYGHTFGEWTTITERTCTQTGIKERVCACGEKETETIVARGYHSFGSWETTTAANCLQAGVKERICTDCGEKETRAISASHSWEEATCTVAKHCSKCNETIGEANGHSWSRGKCTACQESRRVNLTVQKSATVSHYNYNGKVILTTFNITDVSYTIDWGGDSYDITIIIAGEKTYDKDGATSTDSPFIGYEILDENGYVVERLSFGISHVKVGEKTTYKKTIYCDLDPDSNYTLKFVDC